MLVALRCLWLVHRVQGSQFSSSAPQGTGTIKSKVSAPFRTPPSPSPALACTNYSSFESEVPGEGQGRRANSSDAYSRDQDSHDGNLA